MTRAPDPKTLAVHGGQPRRHPEGAMTPPVVQTATYPFDTTQALRDFFEGRSAQQEEYGRYGNPTVRLFEQQIAALEGTQDALAFASGMAAVTTTILALTSQDSHVVLFSDCYRRTRQFVSTMLGRYGVEHTLVPPADLEALDAALRPNTKLVISEAPTNPYQTVPDLRKLATICRERRIKTMIDSTFATPINLRPAEHGIDFVVHSATKYLGGHHDVLGGVVAGKEGLISVVRDWRNVLGGVLDPHAALLLIRGTKTLALRVAQQNESALAMARMLETHPKVRRVYYPGLESHGNHAVAKELMSGFGGVVTFEVEGDLDAGTRLVDAARIPKIAPSLGGVESLIEQPALMSFYELTTEQRAAIGISDALIRYAVGIEETADLIADLEQALKAI
ncbi:MAG: aminotransferase class I/II-fold pyridoxal phosphate-dependent enzyme [Myxococcota bacterium]